MLKKNPECEVLYTALPVKIRNPARRRDEGILQLSQTVRERQAQLGILFDDDGQRCGFVDERGRHVSSAAIARLVVPLLLAERPGATVVLEPAALVELRPLIEAMGGRCQPGETPPPQLPPPSANTGPSTAEATRAATGFSTAMRTATPS